MLVLISHSFTYTSKQISIFIFKKIKRIFGLHNCFQLNVGPGRAFKIIQKQKINPEKKEHLDSQKIKYVLPTIRHFYRAHFNSNLNNSSSI